MARIPQIKQTIVYEDGKLIFAGPLIFKLNAKMDAVVQIGCLMGIQDHQLVRFKFLSLVSLEDLEVLDSTMKMDLQKIVIFDKSKPPCQSTLWPQTMYFHH